MLRLSETHRFLQSSSLWEARCALIGQLSSALWLAEYLKREMEMLRPSPYWRDDKKTIKPTRNEAFVASSGDIITDYNDLYCVFTHCIALHHVNITMSAFVIGESTSTTLHRSKPALESSVAETYLQTWVRSSDCPCDVGSAPKVFAHSYHCRVTLLFQVQETVLRKMRCTYSNIWVELFLTRVL